MSRNQFYCLLIVLSPGLTSNANNPKWWRKPEPLLQSGQAARVSINDLCDSNSHSIFVVFNLRLKTDTRYIKPKKQRTIIMSLGHSKGRSHGEKLGKGEIRVDIFVQRDRF